MNRHFFGKMQSDCRSIGLPSGHGSYQNIVTMGDNGKLKVLFYINKCKFKLIMI